MSVALMSRVWTSTMRDATQVDVLSKLANFAGDDGENCFPGEKLLAALCRISERTVIRTLQKLEEEGWIEILERGGGRTKTRFRINVEQILSSQNPDLQPRRRRHPRGDMVSPLKDSRSDPEKTAPQRRSSGDTVSLLSGDMVSPLKNSRGDIDDKRGVTLATSRGDIGDNPPHPPIVGTIKKQTEKQTDKQRARDGALTDTAAHEPLDDEQRAHLERLKNPGQREYWESHYREVNFDRAQAAERERAEAESRAQLAREIPTPAACATWVMRRIGLVDANDQAIVGPLIEAQAELRAEARDPPWVTGPRMAEMWEKQRRTAPGLLRAKLSAKKFFGTGYWFDSNGWHWDADALKVDSRAREARTGRA